MQVLKRKIKAEEVLNTEDLKMQISFNSDYHLVLRFFNPEKPAEDIVITLTAEQTRQLLRFIRFRLSDC